jgi:hypothetical protein
MNATAEVGICPVCNGTARIPAGDTKYKTIMASYDAATDTFACRNCGGQTMACRGTGRVRLRPDGTPCTHKYQGRQLGNCYWEYTCTEGCGDRHCIDSGD